VRFIVSCSFAVSFGGHRKILAFGGPFLSHIQPKANESREEKKLSANANTNLKKYLINVVLSECFTKEYIEYFLCTVVLQSFGDPKEMVFGFRNYFFV
jgi:hypothetical protein